MNRRNIKRIVYGVAALAFLGMAGYEYAQGGFSSTAMIGLVFGVVMGSFALTGAG